MKWCALHSLHIFVLANCRHIFGQHSGALFVYEQNDSGLNNAIVELDAREDPTLRGLSSLSWTRVKTPPYEVCLKRNRHVCYFTHGLMSGINACRQLECAIKKWACWQWMLGCYKKQQCRRLQHESSSKPSRVAATPESHSVTLQLMKST